ncbi:hypothetical protein ACROYT_G030855 [Oculina patagonica]
MASTSRFREVSEDDIESVLQSAIPEKTKQATKYGIKIFKVRRLNGEPIKVSSLKAIRLAIDRHLKQAPNNKPWSIVGDLEFKKANDTLMHQPIPASDVLELVKQAKYDAGKEMEEEQEVVVVEEQKKEKAEGEIKDKNKKEKEKEEERAVEEE